MNKSVAVIGAGPVGLAAAAHLLERGLEPIVLEAGPEAGHAVRQWQHVQLFSPWEYNVDKAAARLLAPTGWNSPDPQVYPTGAELLERYIQPLATKTVLKDVIRTSSRVTAISRVGFDKAKDQGTRRRANSKSAIRMARARRYCARMPSSTHPAPGVHPTRRVRMDCRRSASARRRQRSPMACRMYLERIARALPAKPSRCSGLDIRPSAR